MRSLQQGFPESIDELVSVVEETPRGRWFLQAYAERLRKGETAAILASIEKLEASLKSMSGSGAEAKLVETTRAAIAQARQEIQNLSPEMSGFSPEGQLFAKLAEQSRQAFADRNETPAIGKSVERALRLVADLERNFASQSMAKTSPQAQQAAYFKQDEAIFEPAPVKPVVVISEPKLQTDAPARGARLVIQRVGDTAHQPQPAASNADQGTADVFGVQATSEAEEKPRITIIRRDVEDLPEVPLPDMTTASESHTAA